MYRCLKSQRRHSIAGFTLIELMVTLVVLAILVTLAVPSLQESFKRNEIVAQNNELVSLIHLARNEAIRRNPQGGETVTLEFLASANKWEGRVRPPESAPGDDQADPDCPPGINAIRCTLHTKASLNAESLLLRFDNRGYLVDTDGNPSEAVLNLTHEECTNQNHARTITVRRGGQVTSDPVSCE